MKMDALRGKKLLNKKGEVVPAENALKNKKVVIYYFSANWCDYCHTFATKLDKIYKEAITRRIPIEIIFVSNDVEELAMQEHYRTDHGNWWAVPFGDPTIHELRLMYGITGIPFVVVVTIDGVILTRNGKREVENIGLNVLTTWY